MNAQAENKAVNVGGLTLAGQCGYPFILANTRSPGLYSRCLFDLGMFLAEMGKYACNYSTVVIEDAAVSGLVHTWSKHAKRRFVIKINKARKIGAEARRASLFFFADSGEWMTGDSDSGC